MNKRVSVVMPVYNVAKYLKDSVSSVLNQTYSDFELILVDDGSTDESGRLCDSLAAQDSRIKAIHKKNGGLSDARNKGVLMSTGDFVTFVDSDDIILPNYIEYLHSLLESADEADYSECAISFRRADKICHRDVSGEVAKLSNVASMEALLYDDRLYTGATAKLYRKRVFDVAMFRVNVHYEDMWFLSDIYLSIRNVIYGGDPLYVYCVRPGSITTSGTDYSAHQHFKAATALLETAKTLTCSASSIERYRAYAELRLLKNLTFETDENRRTAEELKKSLCQKWRKLIKDKRTPLRDKIGILSLMFGLKSYRGAWWLYEQLRG